MSTISDLVRAEPPKGPKSPKSPALKSSSSEAPDLPGQTPPDPNPGPDQGI